MKKVIFAIAFLSLNMGLKAQYGALNDILDRLEERRGMHQEDLANVSIDGKKFYLIKEFDDHTERDFIVLKGNTATYVEVFDDKKTGESTSNVFSGDALRTRKNVVSIRCDKLEGKKISIPITKTLVLMKLSKILYLMDANSKDRWIDEDSLNKKR